MGCSLVVEYIFSIHVALSYKTVAVLLQGNVGLEVYFPERVRQRVLGIEILGKAWGSWAHSKYERANTLNAEARMLQPAPSSLHGSRNAGSQSLTFQKRD